MKALLILISLLFTNNFASAQVAGVSYEWELKSDKKGIQVFTSAVANSKFRAVRAHVKVKASVQSLVGIVTDHANCSNWADLCKEERVIERVSATESYVYSYSDVPFPVTDRDAVAHVIWQHLPEQKKTSMTSVATTGKLAKTKAVRIEDGYANWHFTELDNGETLVENFAHVDPNGPTPAWLTNLLLVDSPIKTLINMRDLAESGAYDDAKIDFLNTP